MKTLIIDIETAPSLAYLWGLFNQNVGLSQVVAATEVICFAAKWAGQRKTVFYSVHTHGREAMVQAAHDLLDEADVVVHYNGTRFDVPHLNREFLMAGLTPPAPFDQVDLLRVVRRRFRFLSNKLDHVVTSLGLDGKASHEGFDLWRKCMEGDPAAWKRMERYNRQDVKITEALYERLLPWVQNHPARPLYDGSSGCPVCGSDRVQRRGYSYTKVSKFQRWHCQGCGAWLRSPKREATTDLRQAAL